jgi:hypothetical protein
MAVPTKLNSRLRIFVLALLIALAMPATLLALTLIGTPRPDHLRGTKGPDRILGLGANDHLYGFAGDDIIVGGPGTDRMYGGTGNDRLEARDGTKDLVDCGPGRDTAIIDNIDVIRSCEIVRRPSRQSGTRSHPTPFGAPYDIGRGWSVKIVSILPDATQRILTWDSSNNPPKRGRQFYMVNFQAKRTGKKPGYLHATFYMHAVGAGGVGYSIDKDSCGSIPDPDLEVDDPLVFHNTTIKGNICWQVRSTDAGKLLMFTAPGKQVYFALH